MCSDWDPDPQSTISKQDPVWFCHSRGKRLFSKGKFTEVSVGRADCHVDFFFQILTTTTQQWKETDMGSYIFFCQGPTFFLAVMWQRVSRTDTFLPHISVAKDTTSYHVTAVWSLNIAWWDISLYFVEWRTCLVVTLWTPSDQCCASDTTRRCIRGAAKCHPSPHLKVSHRGGCVELVQDPRTQRAMWMWLPTAFHHNFTKLKMTPSNVSSFLTISLKPI